MKRFTVHIVPSVWDQIERQVLYIARDSVENALDWESRIHSTLNGLAHFHGHSLDHDASDHLGQPVRKLVFEKTYLIHFQVNDMTGEIRVINFRHGARLPREGEP